MHSWLISRALCGVEMIVPATDASAPKRFAIHVTTAAIAVWIGFTTLMAINLIRLAALTVIASEFPDWFAYFHEYFFQGLFIALLAVLASLWTEQVRRATLRRLPD